MATDLARFTAHWARPAAITTADQPLAPILGMLRYLRSNQWMVLHRGQGNEITGYFPFRKREIESQAAHTDPMRLASEVLQLPLEGAHPVKRRSATLALQSGAFPERQRPVLLDKAGTVVGIGVADDQSKVLVVSAAMRTAEPEPPKIKARREMKASRPRKGDVYIHAESGFVLDPRELKQGKTIHRIERLQAAKDEPVAVIEETIIPVYFGTDREAAHTKAGDLRFTGERAKDAKVTLGVCSVSIPPNHRIGHLERRPWWKFWSSPRRSEHVVLLSTTQLGSTDFFRELKDAIHRPNALSAFVFVHGYNVAFETAAKRTAQLAFDLQFPGAPIMFSWPSKGGTLNYPSDEGSNEWSRPHLRDFLMQVRERAEAKEIHLIAHSMGNRALLSVLHELSGGPKFDQLIIAAPDVDAGIFRQLAMKLPALSKRVTLYASSKDKALAVSKRLHEYARAGEAGENLVVMDGLDTIDASTVDTDFLGHSTFAEQRTLLTDMFNLIRHGHSPASRYGLTQKSHNGNSYWCFKT